MLRCVINLQMFYDM